MAVAKLWRTRTRPGTVPPKYQERLRLLAAMAAHCGPQAPEPGRGPNLSSGSPRLTGPSRRGTSTMYFPRRGVRRSQRLREGRCGPFAYRWTRVLWVSAALEFSARGYLAGYYRVPQAGLRPSAPLCLLALAILLGSPASKPTHIPAAGQAGNRAQRVKKTAPRSACRGTPSGRPGRRLRVLQRFPARPPAGVHRAEPAPPAAAAPYLHTAAQPRCGVRRSQALRYGGLTYRGSSACVSAACEAARGGAASMGRLQRSRMPSKVL